MELEEWLSSISKIGQNSYEMDLSNNTNPNSEFSNGYFDNKLDHLIELLENQGNQSFNNQNQVNELIKSIERLILKGKEGINLPSSHDDYNETNLSSLIKNQDNLVNLIRNFVEVEKNSESEFRSRLGIWIFN